MANILQVRNEAGGWVEIPVIAGPRGERGEKGETGDTGPGATINGVNALTLKAGTGITATQSGSTMDISTNYTYSTTDLTAGSSALSAGQLYFVYE